MSPVKERLKQMRGSLVQMTFSRCSLNRNDQ